MNEKILHLRLINGEELISKVIDSNDQHFVLESPLVVEEVADDYGKFLVLLRYLPYAQNKQCEIDRRHVLVTTELHPEMEKYYFLSLRTNQRSEQKTLDYIRMANQKIEQALTSSVSSPAVDQRVEATHPVSNTIH